MASAQAAHASAPSAAALSDAVPVTPANASTPRAGRSASRMMAATPTRAAPLMQIARMALFALLRTVADAGAAVSRRLLARTVITQGFYSR